MILPLRRLRTWQRALLVAGIAVAAVWTSLLVTRPASLQVGPVTAAVQTVPGTGASFRLGDSAPVYRDFGVGPLQLQMHVTLRTNPALLSAHEPEMLSRLSGARSGLVSMAVRYLLRLAAGALVVALLLSLLVFGRRWRLLVVTGATSLALLTSAAGVAGASMRGQLSDLTSASCAHGWVSYVIPDIASLSPPAPPVHAPAAALPENNPGLIPVELISDVHLNPVGLQFALDLQRATHAQAVLDAGDTTSFGLPAEGCIVMPWIRRFHVPYVWVRGNHDSRTFESEMRAVRSVTVLDNRTATVAGLTFYGLGDPAFTPRSPRDDAAMLRTTETAVPRIAAGVTASPTPPDAVLVHDCRMAVPGGAAGTVAGLVPLVLCGHTHVYNEQTEAGTTILTTGTVGNGGLAAVHAGGFSAVILQFSATAPHPLVSYWQVVSPGGPAPARWVFHVVQPAVQVPAPPARLPRPLL